MVSLSNGAKHGYAITRDVEQQVGVRLGPGTLYGALTKLVERGLIASLPSEDRRRPYEITAAGRTVLADELASWSKVVDVGRARLGWT